MTVSSTPEEKKLTELESEADTVLSEIETKNDLVSDCVMQEPEDAKWFRSESTGWQSRLDFEWSHHPLVMRFGVLVMLLWFLGLLVNIALHPPLPVAPYHIVDGTVVACGDISISSLRGASRVIATVRAPDGQLVQIPVVSGTPLEKGTKIPLRQYANHRYLLDHPL